MANKKTLESYIASATENIVEDRAATKSLLLSLMKFMKSGEEKHREYGTVAAKYLETLQRSNEQLVKITSIVNRDSGSKNTISSDLKEEIYDIIKGGDQSEQD